MSLRQIAGLSGLLCLSLILINCGGGGGSSTPDSVKYLAVSSTQPSANAINVDARQREIKATFSASINVSSLGNLNSSVGSLLSAKGYSVALVSTQAVTSANGLTLGDLISGEYLLVSTDADGNDVFITAASYEFVQEATGYGLEITVQDTGENIYFSASEVRSSGIIDNTVFKVTSGVNSSAVQGALSVSGSTITFRPVRFLEWSTRYTVTISQSIKDSTARSLKNAYSWSFTTQDIPEPAIESVSPLGIEANPLKDIIATPNFVVDPISIQSGNVVLKKLIRTSSDEEPTREDVASTVSYDADVGQIIINPDADLDYLQEYEVTIKGAPSGVTGSLGNIAIGLADDYVWEFTTGEPALLSYSPDVEDSSAPIIEREDKVELTFNFRPDPNLIGAAITITNQNSNDIPYMFEIGGDHQDVVTLTPLSLLDYNTNYRVDVRTSLADRLRNEINLANASDFSFTTVRRKVISETPFSLSRSAETDTTITVGFNFDVAAGAFNDRTHYQIERRIDLGPWEVVPGSASYSNRVMTFTPSELFVFNEEVRVTIYETLPSVDGASIYQQEQWSFYTKNDRLSIADSEPYAGEDDVPFDTAIWVQLTADLDASTVYSDALTVDDCSGYMSGTTQLDGDTLYFLPSEEFDSRCRYEVSLDSSIRGILNEQQEGTNSFTFTTDGLEVENVYVTFAYSDYVDVYTEISIQFNYPLGYVSSSYVTLEGEYGSRVSGNLYKSGDTLDFVPSGRLNYGEEYTLRISSSIEGDLGEELSSSKTYTFITENLPVDVYDYGPTGEVYVDDEFWVDMNYSTSTDGFPDYDGDLSPYETVSLSDSGYTIYMTPWDDLDYSTTYWVEFEFDFDNGYTDDFDFDWSVTTEDEYFASSAMASKASAPTQNYKYMTAQQRKAKAVKAQRGCRADSNCRGSLKTTTVDEYKQSLAAHRRGSLVSAQSAISSLKTRREFKKIHAAEKKLGL